jgi:hypothetical protein
MSNSDNMLGSQWPRVAVFSFLTVLAALLLAGCGGGSSSTTSAATRFAQSYAGNWSGMWSDIDGTSGTSTMAITADSTTHASTVTITLSGGKFGFLGSQSALTGTYDSTGIHVTGPTGQSAVVTLAIDTSGQFTGAATGVSGTVTSISFSGPSTPQAVTLNVTVHHTDGSTETGTITLTKQTV